VNEYEPWAALGLTEAEYFKARHIEHGKEIERLNRIIERLRTELRNLGDVVSDCIQTGTAPSQFLGIGISEALAYDGTEGES